MDKLTWWKLCCTFVYFGMREKEKEHFLGFGKFFCVKYEKMFYCGLICVWGGYLMHFLVFNYLISCLTMSGKEERVNYLFSVCWKAKRDTPLMLFYVQIKRKSKCNNNNATACANRTLQQFIKHVLYLLCSWHVDLVETVLNNKSMRHL